MKKENLVLFILEKKNVLLIVYGKKEEKWVRIV